MGNSASADIFFGIVIYDPEDEQFIVPWLTEDDDIDDASFEDWASSVHGGITRPEGDHPAYGDTSEAANDFREKFKSMCAAKREFMGTIPLEEDHVGYMDGHSRRILKLKGWGKNADYAPEAINPESLVVTSEHREVFAEALEKLGLVGLPEPQIHLVASYG